MRPPGARPPSVFIAGSHVEIVTRSRSGADRDPPPPRHLAPAGTAAGSAGIPRRDPDSPPTAASWGHVPHDLRVAQQKITREVAAHAHRGVGLREVSRAGDDRLVARRLVYRVVPTSTSPRCCRARGLARQLARPGTARRPPAAPFPAVDLPVRQERSRSTSATGCSGEDVRVTVGLERPARDGERDRLRVRAPRPCAGGPAPTSRSSASRRPSGFIGSAASKNSVPDLDVELVAEEVVAPAQRLDLPEQEEAVEASAPLELLELGPRCSRPAAATTRCCAPRPDVVRPRRRSAGPCHAACCVRIREVGQELRPRAPSPCP